MTSPDAALPAAGGARSGRGSSPSPQPGRIAYITSRFPKLSETFVLNEVLALEAQGVAIDVFSLLETRERVQHERARALAGRVQRIHPLSPEALAAQVWWALRSPRALALTWFRALWPARRSPRLLAKSLFVVAVAAAMARRVQAAGVAHVHAHFATHPALAASIIHRLTGLPFSITAHADDLFVQRPGLADKLRLARFVVTISDYNRRFLAEHFGEEIARKTHVVHCGIEPEVFAPDAGARLRAPGPAVPFEIVCVARLEPKKGHTVLIEACALLEERGVSLRCRLVGEGDERARIEAQIEAAGLQGRVELLGPQSREQVIAILRSCDAVVLPSVVAAEGRQEGIPVALMEAMALEVPVVASAISGIPELVRHEQTGLLTKPGDALGLADAIERLSEDPIAAGKLGEQARRHVVDAFDLHRSAERLRALFAGGGDA